MRIFSLGIFLSLTACLMEGGGLGDVPLYEVNECYFTRDLRTGKTIKWEKDKLPVSFYIHISTPDAAYLNFVSAVDFWNIRWGEYMEERGLESSPLVEIIGRGEKFTASGSLIKDSYNMLIFSHNTGIKAITGKLSTPVKEIQAVTYSQKSRGQLKSADILVNQTDFLYFYDDDYNQHILALKSQRESLRQIAFTKSFGFLESLKIRFKNFFVGLLNFFRKERKRDIARFKRPSIPRNSVDFPSLMIHEIGHSIALAHVDEKDKTNIAALRSHSAVSRRLAATDRRREEEKKKSVMKVELPRGTLRREIPDFDLRNIFCGYYEN